MKTLRWALAALMIVLPALVVRAADKDKDKEVAKLQREVESSLVAFKKADSGLEKVLEAAAGYALFPNAGKGGFILGGAHGAGLVYEKGGKLIGSAKLSQVTIGAQIGGQAFAELILFETPEALSRFKESRFEMGAGISAVAAAEGTAQAAKYNEGVLVVTRPIKGLMAEASVGGQKFSFEPVPAGK